MRKLVEFIEGELVGYGVNSEPLHSPMFAALKYAECLVEQTRHNLEKMDLISTYAVI